MFCPSIHFSDFPGLLLLSLRGFLFANLLLGFGFPSKAKQVMIHTGAYTKHRPSQLKLTRGGTKGVADAMSVTSPGWPDAFMASLPVPKVASCNLSGDGFYTCLGRSLC